MPPPQQPGPPAAAPGPGSGAKTALRDQLLTSRRRRSLTQRADDARALAEQVLALDEVRRAATVAAYVSVGTEPGTGPLLHALVAAGKRVVLPLLQPDGDLDWAAYDGDDALVAAGRGLLQPTGRALGPDSIGTADVVLVPGLAVSPTGDRLGRGGGSYDRALARVPVGTPVCILLYDDEVGLAVPTEPHDRPVTTAVSPASVTRLRH